MKDEGNLNYLRAKDAVKRIRGFYGHLAIYVFVILVAIIGPFLNFAFCFFCFSDNHWMNLLGLIPWGIGVLAHGIIALGRFKPLLKWEERKLREFIDEDSL